MARIILGAPTPRTQSGQAKLQLNHAPRAQMSASAVEARLRQKRSAAYVNAVARLDAGGHIHDRAAVESLIAVLQQELPELIIEDLPLGIVSRCYLGAPYEVHTLDREGSIIQHYKTSERLPDTLERARALALHSSYVFVEVYRMRLVAVDANGSTSLVEE